MRNSEWVAFRIKHYDIQRPCGQDSRWGDDCLALTRTCEWIVFCINPSTTLYNSTMFAMAGLLAIAFVSNLLIGPVDKKHHMKE